MSTNTRLVGPCLEIKTIIIFALVVMFAIKAVWICYHLWGEEWGGTSLVFMLTSSSLFCIGRMLIICACRNQHNSSIIRVLRSHGNA